MSTSFYSHGKLLLTGEYVVLDGALALAFPTKLGQSLTISESKDHTGSWTSLDREGDPWFRAEMVWHGDHLVFVPVSQNREAKAVAKKLEQLLSVKRQLNATFLQEKASYDVTTHLEFDRSWGLGSSSTLINNVAQWAAVDAFALQRRTFPGSGYDIACARSDSPILYKLVDGKPQVKRVSFAPCFAENLFFVHLNRKQSSREAITRYRALDKDDLSIVQQISEITKALLACKDLVKFSQLLDFHEELISHISQLPTIKERLFKDSPFTIKSLGAWGGDFVLVVGEETAVLDYFSGLGYRTIVPFSDLLL